MYRETNKNILLFQELASAGVVSVSEEEDEKEGKDEPPAKRAKVEEAA